jgi:hypothetical protein
LRTPIVARTESGSTRKDRTLTPRPGAVPRLRVSRPDLRPGGSHCAHYAGLAFLDQHPAVGTSIKNDLALPLEPLQLGKRRPEIGPRQVTSALSRRLSRVPRLATTPELRGSSIADRTMEVLGSLGGLPVI